MLLYLGLNLSIIAGTNTLSLFVFGLGTVRATRWVRSLTLTIINFIAVLHSWLGCSCITFALTYDTVYNRD